MMKLFFDHNIIEYEKEK